MIPRILVPKKLQLPAAGEAPPQRTFTFLDERQLVPTNLPIVPLDAKSNIPAHVPLEVLGERTVVPRHLPNTPLQVESEIPAYVQLDVLDSRITVPVDARPEKLTMGGPLDVEAFRDVLEPDVLTTGEANLLIDIEAEKLPIADWIPPWVAPVGTAAIHIVLFLVLVFAPQLFPSRPPTVAEIEAAARSLGMVYLPPEVNNVPKKVNPDEQQSNQIRIDPRILRQLIPEKTPSPLPGTPAPPAVTQREQAQLPEAPRPQRPVEPNREIARNNPQTEAPHFDPVKPSESPSRLLLPRTSPGRSLEDLARGTANAPQSGPNTSFGGRMPGGSTGGSPGGGGGEGYLGGAMQMLTPTEGVDFSNYLARVLASIKRNWYAIIPESARLGDRGRVILQFRILRDGSVPTMDPRLLATSTKEQLDKAAMSSIRASNPFEPLPQQFSGPFIELRIIFLYNLPLDYQ